MKKGKSHHSSLVVEAPDLKYEEYWNNETMEIVEGKGAQSNKTSSKNHHHHHRSHNNNHSSKQESSSSSIHSITTTPPLLPLPTPTPIIGPIFNPNYPFVILDCANLGWSFGASSFSALGIKIAFETLQSLPINVYGFIPASYVRRKPTDGSRGNSLMETEEWEIMDQLIRSRKLSVVPPGDSDDLYILNFAQNHDGYVISNDFFNDHLAAIESLLERQQAAEWLHQRRVSYTFTPEYEGNFSLMLNPSSELVHRLISFTQNEKDLDEEELETSMALET